MPLLHILHQLDAELDRLTSLRKIVVSLAKSPAVLKKITPKLDGQLKAEPEGREAPRRQGRLRRLPSISKSAARLPKNPTGPQPTALAKKLPSGPVVVSAQALAEEQERRAAVRKQQTEIAGAREMAPESLARDLAARWLNGMSTAHV